MNNLDIRNLVKRHKIKLWQIAETLGMSDCTFSRKLRHELSENQKQEIRKIINNIRGGKNE